MFVFSYWCSLFALHACTDVEEHLSCGFRFFRLANVRSCSQVQTNEYVFKLIRGFRPPCLCASVLCASHESQFLLVGLTMRRHFTAQTRYPATAASSCPRGEYSQAARRLEATQSEHSVVNVGLGVDVLVVSEIPDGVFFSYVAQKAACLRFSPHGVCNARDTASRVKEALSKRVHVAFLPYASGVMQGFEGFRHGPHSGLAPYSDGLRSHLVVNPKLEQPYNSGCPVSETDMKNCLRELEGMRATCVDPARGTLSLEVHLHSCQASGFDASGHRLHGVCFAKVSHTIRDTLGRIAVALARLTRYGDGTMGGRARGCRHAQMLASVMRITEQEDEIGEAILRDGLIDGKWPIPEGITVACHEVEERPQEEHDMRSLVEEVDLCFRKVDVRQVIGWHPTVAQDESGRWSVRFEYTMSMQSGDTVRVGEEGLFAVYDDTEMSELLRVLHVEHLPNDGPLRVGRCVSVPFDDPDWGKGPCIGILVRAVQELGPLLVYFPQDDSVYEVDRAHTIVTPVSQQRYVDIPQDESRSERQERMGVRFHVDRLNDSRRAFDKTGVISKTFRRNGRMYRFIAIAYSRYTCGGLEEKIVNREAPGERKPKKRKGARKETCEEQPRPSEAGRGSEKGTTSGPNSDDVALNIALVEATWLEREYGVPVVHLLGRCEADRDVARTWVDAAMQEGLPISQLERDQAKVVVEMSRTHELLISRDAWVACQDSSRAARNLHCLVQLFLVCWVCSSKTAGGRPEAMSGLGRGRKRVYDVPAAIRTHFCTAASTDDFLTLFSQDLHKVFEWVQARAATDVNDEPRATDVYAVYRGLSTYGIYSHDKGSKQRRRKNAEEWVQTTAAGVTASERIRDVCARLVDASTDRLQAVSTYIAESGGGGTYYMPLVGGTSRLAVAELLCELGVLRMEPTFCPRAFGKDAGGRRLLRNVMRSPNDATSTMLTTVLTTVYKTLEDCGVVSTIDACIDNTKMPAHARVTTLMGENVSCKIGAKSTECLWSLVCALFSGEARTRL